MALSGIHMLMIFTFSGGERVTFWDSGQLLALSQHFFVVLGHYFEFYAF